jgi:hypothetical protein
MASNDFCEACGRALLATCRYTHCTQNPGHCIECTDRAAKVCLSCVDSLMCGTIATARKSGRDKGVYEVVRYLLARGHVEIAGHVSEDLIVPTQQQQAPSPAVASKLCEKCGGKGVLRIGRIGVATCGRCDGIGLLP